MKREIDIDAIEQLLYGFEFIAKSGDFLGKNEVIDTIRSAILRQIYKPKKQKSEVSRKYHFDGFQKEWLYSYTQNPYKKGLNL